MPIRKSDYPPDWDAISIQVRTEAGWKCEWCQAPGDKVVRRFPGGSWAEVEQIRAEPTAALEETAGMTWKRLKFHGLTKIVLTVAHLDRDSTNNDRENLACLCQQCHLNYDRPSQHIPNRKYGRFHTKHPQLKIEF